MYYIQKSSKSIPDAVRDLEVAVQRHGFGVLHVYDLKAKADRALSYGTVVETLDVLNRLGIENIGMLTDTSASRASRRR